jgi:hypothetical protein
VYLLAVWIEKKLVMVEAVTLGWHVRPEHAVSVQLSWPGFRQVAMPNHVCLLRNLYAMSFSFAGGVEETKLHFFGMFGVERKVNALSVPCRSERIRPSRPNNRLPLLTHLFLSSCQQIISTSKRQVPSKRETCYRDQAWEGWESSGRYWMPSQWIG